MEITLATNIKVGTKCTEIILSQDIMEKETGNVKTQDQESDGPVRAREGDV